VDLHNYLEVLRRRWIGVTIVALATMALAAAVTLAMTTKYTATTRLYVAIEGSDSLTDPSRGSSLAETQLTSYAEVATSPLVLDQVIDQLDLHTSSTELARSVTAAIRPDTVLLEISAVDRDPKRAAAIANAIGARVDEVAGELWPEHADGSKAVRATTLAPALVPTHPSSPKVLRNVALGILLGLLFGVVAVMHSDARDRRIHKEHDVRSVSDAPRPGGGNVTRPKAAAAVADAEHEPLRAAHVVAAAAPKRARPEPMYDTPSNGRANGSVQKERQRSREATPVPR
jgi:succinoglycan biosynthesis transport protein ExoP